MTSTIRKAASSPQKMEQNQMRFYFHMHLNSLGKGKEHISVTDEWETDKIVGEGAYGIVLSLRHKQTHTPGSMILKISPFIDLKMKYDPSQADAFFKEILYLNHLFQNEYLMIPPTIYNQQTKPQPIVPQLYAASVNFNPSNRCVQGLQVMEQFDGTMTQLGETQAVRLGKPNGVFVFYDYQIFNMIQLSHILDSCDIVHGDLKPRNIVYRENGRILKLIDCAFMGYSWFYNHNDEKHKQQQENIFYRPQIGFPGLPFRELVNRQHPTNPPAFPSHLWRILNRLQLYFALMVHRKTWIIKTTENSNDDKNESCEQITILEILKWIKLSQKEITEFLNLYQQKSTFLTPKS